MTPTAVTKYHGLLAAVLMVCAMAPARGQGRSLEVYWIDVEGGAATLIVTPAGESVLIDTGYPDDRGAPRIHKVATEAAGLRRIDHLIVTHFHIDHFGGAVPLSKLMPIERVYDNGEPAPPPSAADAPFLERYKETFRSRRLLSPGDTIPLRAAAGGPVPALRLLGTRQEVASRAAAAGVANAERCAAATRKAPDTSDNANSTVWVLELGDFRMFDAGDLTWNVEEKYACPANVVGPVDVYQVTHHGLDASNNPALVRSLAPTVAVMNNGPRKGTGAETVATLNGLASLKGRYQLHKNVRDDSQNSTPDEFIANVEEQCSAGYVKMTVEPDGRRYAIEIPGRRHKATFATTGKSPAALLLLDEQRLSDVRARARAGDSRVAEQVAALEANARKALGMAPVSVMDKRVAPPSGNKHDYMSQAPYWWPDPSKPDGLPYIRRDGQRNTEIDRISDHDNLGRLTGAVRTLGLAYSLTGREEYAAHAARLVRVWFLDAATRMTPHLEYGQGIPGINQGRGIGIIETRGLPDMLDGVLLLAGSPAWTPEDDRGLREWMAAYARWLVESAHGKAESKNGNNHETWYDVQVAALALYTGQPDLARRTLEHSRERIARQIEPDGRQPRELERTRSWDYSLFNLTAFFHLARLGERVGVDLWHHRTPDGRSLRAALDFLVPFAEGAAKWTHPQITRFDPATLQPLLRRAALAWNESKYAALAERLGASSEILNSEF